MSTQEGDIASPLHADSARVCLLDFQDFALEISQAIRRGLSMVLLWKQEFPIDRKSLLNCGLAREALLHPHTALLAADLMIAGLEGNHELQLVAYDALLWRLELWLAVERRRLRPLLLLLLFTAHMLFGRRHWKRRRLAVVAIWRAARGLRDYCTGRGRWLRVWKRRRRNCVISSYFVIEFLLILGGRVAASSCRKWRCRRVIALVIVVVINVGDIVVPVSSGWCRRIRCAVGARIEVGH